MTVACKRRLLAIILLALLVILHTFLIARFESEQNSKALRSERKRCLKNNETQGAPNCEAILAGDEEETCRWYFYHRNTSDQSFLESINKDNSFLSAYQRRASVEELDFPIAFSISIHRNVFQFERLLRSIYWPQNLYCVHVDRRAPREIRSAVEILIAQLPNVFSTEAEPVYWAGYGVLRAVLNCMNDTLTKFGSHKWRYFINLSGMDFPLKTNLELVKILKLLNGSNDVEFEYELQFSRYWFSYRPIYDSDGHPYTHVPDMTRPKSPAPHHLKVYKGNLAASLSREFVEYLFRDKIALDFIDWLRDTDTSDEHLWATLNYNAVAKAPGSFPVECHNDSSFFPTSYISRYAVWRGANENRLCSGRFVRDVCIFGVRDLGRLTRPTARKELFVNKFHADFQSAALDCMEFWFQWRTRNGMIDLDEDFYSSLPNVLYQNGKVDRSCAKKFDVVRDRLPDKVKKYIKGGTISKINRF